MLNRRFGPLGQGGLNIACVVLLASPGFYSMMASSSTRTGQKSGAHRTRITNWLMDSCYVKGNKLIKHAKRHSSIPMWALHHLQGAWIFADIPQISNVGQPLLVKNTVEKTVKAIKSHTAQEAMDNCTDIQVELQEFLELEKVQEIFYDSVLSSLWCLCVMTWCIQWVIFCCIYTALSQTTRAWWGVIWPEDGWTNNQNKVWDWAIWS